MNTAPYSTNSMPLYTAWVQPQARLCLCICVFLLTAMPRMNVKLGGVPIYIIDLFAALAVFYAHKVRVSYRFRHPFGGYILAIAFFMVFGEIAAAIYSGDVVRPIYALARSLIALSLAYSVARIVQTPEDMQAVIKAAILGIGITSLLMIFSSLAATKGMVAATVFSIPNLEPASAAADKYSQFQDLSTRGRSLVGVSILSGAFINSFWPLIALYIRIPGADGLWKRLALACSLLAPFGVVMSYSRGAILGLVLVIGGLLFYGSRRSRRGIIAAATCAVLVFSYVGWDSDLFYFERVVERTEAMLTNPYKDERERDRLYAYSEPFAHVLGNPEFFFVGEGTAIGKTGALTEQTDKATHAVFAQAYYSYGMIAAFTYVLMAVAVLRHLLRQLRARRPAGMLTPLFYQSLFAGFLGMLSWFVFGHAAVSTPRGAMLLFCLLGLIAALRNVEASEASRWYGRNGQ